MAITFQQIVQNDPGNVVGQATITGLFGSIQTAGNTNVVWVTWIDDVNNPLTISVADTKNNTYVQAGGYCRNNAAGASGASATRSTLWCSTGGIAAAAASANTVTATFSASSAGVPVFCTIQAVEYSGVDTISPIYNAVNTAGISGAAGNITIPLIGYSLNDLFIAAGPTPDNDDTGAFVGLTQRGVVTTNDKLAWGDAAVGSTSQVTNVGWNLGSAEKWNISGAVLRASGLGQQVAPSSPPLRSPNRTGPKVLFSFPTQLALVTASTTHSYTASISESITDPSDSVTRAFVGARSISESITNPTDSVSRGQVSTKSISESITTPSDSVTRAFVGARSIAESIGISDAAARAFVGARSISESISTPTDAIVAAQDQFRSIATSGVGDNKSVTPGTIVNGDTIFLLAWYYNNNTSTTPGLVTCTPPPGFTSQFKTTYNYVGGGAVSNQQINFEIFQKTASSESGAYTVTMSNNDAGAAAYTNLACLVDPKSRSVVRSAISTNTGGPSTSSVTATALSVTAPSGGGNLLWVFAGGDEDSSTPSGMFAAVTDLDGVNGVAELAVSSGPTGSLTGTVAGESIQQNGWIALQILLGTPNSFPTAFVSSPPNRIGPKVIFPFPNLARVGPTNHTFTGSISESITDPSDAVSRAFTGSRSISDSIATPSDALTSSQVLARSISESISTPSDAVVRSFAGFRGIADSVANPSDAVARTVVNARSVSDSVSAPTDAITRTYVGARGVAEAVSTPSDSLTRSQVLGRTPTESITVSDSPTRAFVGSRSLSESVGISDSVSRSFVGSRAIAENVSTPSDTIIKVQVLGRSVSESVAVPSDALSRIFIGARSISESIPGLSDAANRMLGAFRSVSDSVAAPSDSLPSRIYIGARTITEAVADPTDSVVRGASRLISESISGPTDAVSQAQVLARVLSESSTTPSDLVARGFVGFRTSSESVSGPSDALARIYSGVRSVSESVTIPSDGLARQGVFTRILAESVATPVDVILRVLVLVRSSPESITTPSDSVSKGHGYLKSLTESLATPSDAIQRTALVTGTVPESIPIPSDVVSRTIVIARTVPDNIPTPSDVVSSISFDKNLSENISTPSDVIVRISVARGTAESISTPLDSVSRIFVTNTASFLGISSLFIDSAKVTLVPFFVSTPPLQVIPIPPPIRSVPQGPAPHRFEINPGGPGGGPPKTKVGGLNE